VIERKHKDRESILSPAINSNSIIVQSQCT
jgi:hypothetical protein